jgi:hypothetical protein
MRGCGLHSAARPASPPGLLSITLNPRRIKMQLHLNSDGEYVFKDAVGGIAAVKMTGVVQSRVKQIDRRFRLNVDGLCVSGHTLRDPHGRLAYEWDVVGTTSDPDWVEECVPVMRDWPAKPVYYRQVAVPLPRRPWWKRVLRIA